MESLIGALILLTAFMFLMQVRINSMLNTFILQSVLLSSAILVQALKTNDSELYISLTLTIASKVIFIPYLLRYFINKLNIRDKVADIKHPFLLLLSAIVLVLFCHHLSVAIGNIFAIAMSVMLLGMLLLITHRKAVSHVIGFMSMENGIFFAALTATKHGMPMAVELGIAFDVLVAAILFGVFFLQLRRSIDSLDVDRLSLLREDVE